MQGLISSVKHGSLAEAAGIKAGESLLAVNGSSVRDIIDLSFLLADEQVVLTVAAADGTERSITIDKRIDEDLGLEFESAVFDKVTTCYNKCVFCFVDQMIPGMRKGLYVRDDDYRLSFLYGNFITLTNMKDEDFDRIIKTHMSPLYVSVHATDPKVRCEMMKNRFAGELMDKLKRLFDAGITVHTQIVCCPGYNDGEVLKRTYADLRALAPMVETMAVVPVGLTKNRAHLTPLRLFTPQEAADIVTMVTGWQRECRASLGKSFVYLGDEFYILAGMPLPQAEWYDGFPQLENGIGLSRNFMEEWQKASKIAPVKGEVNSVIPVGTSAYKVLQPLIEAFNAETGMQHKLIAVENEFFGNTVNVTGLLCGKDILNAVKGAASIILPEVVLNSDDLFLDDMSYAEFCSQAGEPVHRAASAGDLYKLLQR
ncbi:MAG: DUF512 domain-containing protein [Phascolarctobacterium sp.]|nr:MAG: DUF512 domain-containing protein [Phascolarctobacterium sp.]